MMTNKEVALPWFPITPDYIDQYHESVLKYIRDIRNDESLDLSVDSSYTTTANLLHQRAEQIAAEVSETEFKEIDLIGADTLIKYIKILASAALICDSGLSDAMQRYMLVVVYLLSILKKDLSDTLVPIYIRFLTSERITSVGFTINDIIDFVVLDFVKKIGKSDCVTGETESWYENHGTVKSSGGNIMIYDLNRFFLAMKKGAAFKPILSVEDDTVQLLQDKKDKAPFNITSFINIVSTISPHAPTEEKKKVYSEGESLTVKVQKKEYERIVAVSTDPAYEPLTLPVKIITGSNIRGINMADVARNISVASTLNVTYHQDQECFSIDEKVLDYIYNTYWEDDAESLNYEKMNAKLVFQYYNNVPNTWLTEYGFLVRTGYEDLPRNTCRILKIDGYKHDWLQASMTDEEPTMSEINEKSVKDILLQHFFSSSQRIITQGIRMKEVRLMNKEQISLLHRVLAIRLNNAFVGSEDKSTYIKICCALAAITGDYGDLDYYQVLWSYHQHLIAFAQKDFKNIQSLDVKGVSGNVVLMMAAMVEALRVYDQSEESDMLNKIISDMSDTKLSDVAKLVQASNRFIGSLSLEQLRDDLHKEICSILNVADAIKSVSSLESTDVFPFPPEDEHIEHKMSWVYDNDTSQPNETEQSFKILKTICAYMNRYPWQGESHLYIGIDEKRRYINGIKADIDFLIAKGELTAKGDSEDEYCRHIMAIIKKRFPETYQYVSPHLKENGQVLDLCVSPVIQGVVYLGDVAYYRYGSESRKMPDNIRQEIIDRKYLQHNDMADKIDAINKAIQTKHCVVLKGYDSSNSNTSGTDRLVEVFSFVDNGRNDAIWAYDFSGKVKKNKVFLLRRAAGVEVSSKEWANVKHHKKYSLDMFGFYGEDRFELDIEIKTIRAKNLLVEQYPDSKDYLESLPDRRWRLCGPLLNKLSLDAACGFYLGLADDIDISKSPVFKEHVRKRVESLIDNL